MKSRVVGYYQGISARNLLPWLKSLISFYKSTLGYYRVIESIYICEIREEKRKYICLPYRGIGIYYPYCPNTLRNA